MDKLKKLIEIYRVNYVTKLRGRYDFMMRLEKKFKKKDFILCYHDVIGLHKANRLHSFEFGDNLLKEVAEQLLVFTVYENAFHISGDEFYTIHKVEDCSKIKLDNVSTVRVKSKDYNSIYEMLTAIDLKMIKAKKKLKRRCDEC